MVRRIEGFKTPPTVLGRRLERSVACMALQKHIRARKRRANAFCVHLDKIGILIAGSLSPKHTHELPRKHLKRSTLVQVNTPEWIACD